VEEPSPPTKPSPDGILEEPTPPKIPALPNPKPEVEEPLPPTKPSPDGILEEPTPPKIPILPLPKPEVEEPLPPKQPFPVDDYDCHEHEFCTIDPKPSTYTIKKTKMVEKIVEITKIDIVKKKKTIKLIEMKDKEIEIDQIEKTNITKKETQTMVNENFTDTPDPI
jgi:hypothetical protein